MLQFKEYTIGSAIGILPGVCLFVAVGRLASSIAQVVNGDVDTDPRILIATVAVSIVVLLVVVIILTRYAKKALADKIGVTVEDQPQDDSEAVEANPGAASETEVSLGVSGGDIRPATTKHAAAVEPATTPAPTTPAAGV